MIQKIIAGMIFFLEYRNVFEINADAGTVASKSAAYYETTLDTI